MLKKEKQKFKANLSYRVDSVLKKKKKPLGLQVSIMPSRESREDLWTGPSGRLTSKRPNKENAVFHHSKSCTWIPGLSRLNLPAVELG
jgi:hypothetical protein